MARYLPEVSIASIFRLVSLLPATWLLCLSSAAMALQLDNPESEPRDFHDAKGEVITSGLLVSSDGTKFVVAASNGNVELRLSDLAPEDKTWIRDELKRRKLVQEADEVMNELHLANGSGKSHLVFKALRKLRPYGANAFHSGPVLIDLLKRDFLDVKTRQEVLATYIATTPLRSEVSEQVLKFVLQEWSTCQPLVEADPVEFLVTYARFGDWAEDYLVAVAYTGELKPSPGQQAPTSPRNKDLADDTLTLNRAAAVRALGELKNERSLEIILELFQIFERGDPSKADLEAQKLGLEAIAANGISNENVERLLERLNDRFPEQVARVRTRLSKSAGK